VHPRHPIVSVPHLSTSYPTVPSRVLLHVRWVSRNSQLWLHHRRTRRVHHARVTLVWRNRVCGSHDRAHHATSAPALGGMHSVGLLWDGAIRHRRRGSTIHPLRVRNHLVREWRRDGTHHRSGSLTRWGGPLVHRYPHWLWMHVRRTMTADHHPARNWTTLRIHHLPRSRRVARQRRRISRPISRAIVLLLSRGLSREVV